ncbi:toll/interleukin-1 receptor domain-containing protein [Novosphingobium sp.]|uniref:toll/interleukin-1 receptor domain-containing protein n=1 Tax=Novosphingobium sp. TaxID=1874826 RepID=UPI0038BC3C4A
MSFVFISHASQAKPRVKPLIDRLRAEGFKIWLDNPEATGYSKEEAKTFYRIDAAKRWQDEIEEAKRRADCILVCWSKHAVSKSLFCRKNHDTWMDEISYGRTELKLVTCSVDGVKQDKLPNNFSAIETPSADPDLDPKTWDAAAARIVDAIRLTLSKGLGKNADRASRASLSLPVFANREDQYEEIARAASRAKNSGGIHPVIVMGAANELPFDFIDRMRLDCSRFRADKQAWSQFDYVWPARRTSSEAFQQALRTRLASKLGMSDTDNDQQIAKTLADYKLTAIVGHLEAKDWRRIEEPLMLRAWLDYWSALVRLNNDVTALPILVVSLPDARPGFRRRFTQRSGGPVGINEIARTLRRVADDPAKRPEGLTLAFPPVLDPITRSHAQDWLRLDVKQMAPASHAVIDARLDALYASWRARKFGICHRDFNKQLSPLCGTTA